MVIYARDTRAKFTSNSAQATTLRRMYPEKQGREGI
jgi:hypothetical protein